MTGLGDATGQEAPTETQDGSLSRSRRVRDRINTRGFLLGAGAITLFLVTVGLVMYFKPGSTVQPSGEPSLDRFAAGPADDFPAGTATLFENEHLFLVRLESGALLALYDLPPTAQALVANGDEKALECRATLRMDEEMAGWLAQAGAPAGFEDRGIWDECSGAAWDVTGNQVHGPENGLLDRFDIEIDEGIIWIDLASRECRNPVTPEAPCIETQ